MNQLVFLTAFLGLTLGTQPVRLEVKSDIKTVELRLDGSSIATLHAPWQTKIDVGTSLLPHRLVAIGRDADGTEIARAEQKTQSFSSSFLCVLCTTNSENLRGARRSFTMRST